MELIFSLLNFDQEVISFDLITQCLEFSWEWMILITWSLLAMYKMQKRWNMHILTAFFSFFFQFKNMTIEKRLNQFNFLKRSASEYLLRYSHVFDIDDKSIFVKYNDWWIWLDDNKLTNTLLQQLYAPNEAIHLSRAWRLQSKEI